MVFSLPGKISFNNFLMEMRGPRTWPVRLRGCCVSTGGKCSSERRVHSIPMLGVLSVRKITSWC